MHFAPVDLGNIIKKNILQLNEQIKKARKAKILRSMNWIKKSYCYSEIYTNTIFIMIKLYRVTNHHKELSKSFVMRILASIIAVLKIEKSTINRLNIEYR